MAIPLNQHVSFVLNERHYDVGKINVVPDGFYLGTHEGSRIMRYVRYQGSDEVADGFLDSSPRDTHYAYVDKADNRDDIGETRLYAGARDAYGKPLTIRMIVTRARGEKQLDATLMPLIRLESVDLTGKFADGPVTLQLEDPSRTAVGALQGTFLYNDNRLLIRGHRRGTRGAFLFVNPQTGRSAGYGYAEWTPTPETVSKMRDSRSGRTDQVVLWFTMRGMASATGMKRTLRRQD